MILREGLLFLEHRPVTNKHLMKSAQPLWEASEAHTYIHTQTALQRGSSNDMNTGRYARLPVLQLQKHTLSSAARGGRSFSPYCTRILFLREHKRRESIFAKAETSNKID